MTVRDDRVVTPRCAPRQPEELRGPSHRRQAGRHTLLRQAATVRRLDLLLPHLGCLTFRLSGGAAAPSAATGC